MRRTRSCETVCISSRSVLHVCSCASWSCCLQTVLTSGETEPFSLPSASAGTPMVLSLESSHHRRSDSSSNVSEAGELLDLTAMMPQTPLSLDALASPPAAALDAKLIDSAGALSARTASIPQPQTSPLVLAAFTDS